MIDINPDFLHINKIREWQDMPLWIDNDYFSFDNPAMLRDFNYTPLPFTDTLRKTVRYYENQNWPKPKYGLSEADKNRLIGML